MRIEVTQCSVSNWSVRFGNQQHKTHFKGTQQQKTIETKLKK